MVDYPTHVNRKYRILNRRKINAKKMNTFNRENLLFDIVRHKDVVFWVIVQR